MPVVIGANVGTNDAVVALSQKNSIASVLEACISVYCHPPASQNVDPMLDRSRPILGAAVVADS